MSIGQTRTGGPRPHWSTVSSTGLEQTGAMYLHLLSMLFLPVLPEGYSFQFFGYLG